MGLASMGMDLGLDSTTALLDALGRPDHQVPTVVHVAGSNGKGSVCALLAALSQRLGHRTLLFTSPHVARIEERVRLDGRPMQATEFDEAIGRLRTASARIGVRPTFFEATLLVSWILAAKHRVDVVVQETGLGGRLDATRATRADLALVTSVSLEHASILGGTLEAIMEEKAAIARPDVPLLIRDPEDASVLDAAQRAANRAGPPAELVVVPVPANCSVWSEARLLCAEAAQHLGWDAGELEDLADRVRWPGRRQWIQPEHTGGAAVLVDAAHNPSGLRRVMPELVQSMRDEANLEGWSLVFGCTEQEDLDLLLSVLLEGMEPHPPSRILLVAPEGGRRPGVAPSLLANHAWPVEAEVVEKVGDLREALRGATRPSLVVGSLYLAGNLIAALGLDGDEDLALLPSEG